MLTVNLFDSEFPNQPSCVNGKTPRLLTYTREQMHWDGITLFTDRRMFSEEVARVKCSHKVGWLLEARELRPWYYTDVQKVAHEFEYILTYDAELLALDPSKYLFYPRGGVWTPREQWGIYGKSKLFSMILSEKRETEGHKLRHAIAEAGLPIDLYGPEYTPIGTDKSIALKDYRYSIVVESSYAPNFFSEHLLDCMAFGTLPVYRGCPNIGEWFDDMLGIVKWTAPEYLKGFCAWKDSQLNNLYAVAWHALKRNLEALPTYEITDDWIASHYFL